METEPVLSTHDANLETARPAPLTIPQNSPLDLGFRLYVSNSAIGGKIEQTTKFHGLSSSAFLHAVTTARCYRLLLPTWMWVSTLYIMSHEMLAPGDSGLEAIPVVICAIFLALELSANFDRTLLLRLAHRFQVVFILAWSITVGVCGLWASWSNHSSVVRDLVFSCVFLTSIPWGVLFDASPTYSTRFKMFILSLNACVVLQRLVNMQWFHTHDTAERVCLRNAQYCLGVHAVLSGGLWNLLLFLLSSCIKTWMYPTELLTVCGRVDVGTGYFPEERSPAASSTYASRVRVRPTHSPSSNSVSPNHASVRDRAVSPVRSPTQIFVTTPSHKSRRISAHTAGIRGSETSGGVAEPPHASDVIHLRWILTEADTRLLVTHHLDRLCPWVCTHNIERSRHYQYFAKPLICVACIVVWVGSYAKHTCVSHPALVLTLIALVMVVLLAEATKVDKYILRLHLRYFEVLLRATYVLRLMTLFFLCLYFFVYCRLSIYCSTSQLTRDARLYWTWA